MLTCAIAAPIVGVLIVWITFSGLLDDRARIFDVLEPVSVRSERLRSSLIDQETGIRGYALVRDRRFLEPYDSGRANQLALTASLLRLLPSDDRALRLDIAHVTRDVELWRRLTAAPILAAPIPASDLDRVLLESKRQFDAVRASADVLSAHLAADRRDGRAHLDVATERLGAAIAASLALLTGLGIAGWWLLRVRVVRPIDQLVEVTDRVADGAFSQPIEVVGPIELEHLGQRVDQMRTRIVEQLDSNLAARAVVEQQAEELARSNRDLEQFAYVASHDLQEPLRKVASFCQLLEQRYGDELDERGRTYIDFAVDGAKRMQVLISDLLDFSRIGHTTERFVPCDLAAIARDVVASLDDALTETGGRVDVGPLPTIAGDPALLAALLQNLIMNALKYRRPTVAPVVELAAEADDGEWVFTCRDNGIGIEPQYRTQVFVIFQRLHGREEYSGTGIGLALCKKIVEFHGGRIWIDGPDTVDGTAEPAGAVVRWALPERQPVPTTTPPPTEMKDLPS